MSTLPNPTIAYRSQDLLLQLRRPKGPFTAEAIRKALAEASSMRSRLQEDVVNLHDPSGLLGGYIWVWYHLAATWPVDFNAWEEWSDEFILSALHDVLNPTAPAKMDKILENLFEKVSTMAGARVFESDEKRQGSFQHTNAAEALGLLTSSGVGKTDLSQLGFYAQCTEVIFIFNRFTLRGEVGRKPLERVLIDLCSHWFMNDKPRTDWRNTWKRP